MFFIVSHTICLLAGFVAGLLMYRNNVSKLQTKESEGKKLLDALKGK
jgi:hypothetical protein